MDKRSSVLKEGKSYLFLLSGGQSRDNDLARIRPTRSVYVNVYGRYHFNLEEAQGWIGLRPLRQVHGPIP